MPRKRRFVKQNSFHHIMFRGVNGENIFIDDVDRSRFCLLLQEACEKYSIRIHGFCFMSNHIHLILEPIEDSLQAGIHSFSFRYAQFFNRRHKRRGYLFQGRFRSIIVEDGVYLKRLIRYIHLNPLEAKITECPEKYKWSSYRAYLEHENYVWLETDYVLKRFADSRELAIKKLIEFTHEKINIQSDFEIISKAFRKGIFGGNDFMKEGLLSLSEPILHQEIVNEFQISLSVLINKICQFFDVNLEDLVSSKKNERIIKAREALALAVRKSKNISLEELGRILNKNSGTLSRQASRAEQDDHLQTIVTRIIS